MTPTPHTRTRIERFELGAPGFAGWLHYHRQLQKHGWQVAVVLAKDESHAVALAYDAGNAREPESQLSLLAEGAGG